MDGLPKMKWLLKMQRKDRTIITFSTILMALLSGCASSVNIFDQPIPIGSIWEAVADDRGDINWSSAPPIAQEQNAGYALGRKTLNDDFLQDVVATEGNRQDDVQVAIRGMVENKDHPIAAVLGATTNEATMRAAALVNFFNVPMIIPTANGDNLLPSNNLWAFRLSAPGSAYASYLFGTVLTKAEFGSDPETTADSPRLKVAILYEENTFGESAAVATVRAAMQLGVGVDVYASFPPENPDPARLNRLLNAVRDGDIQLVYLISNDPDVAKTLAQLFQNGFPSQAMPVLVGQAGGFASRDFISSPEAEGIYILRQSLDPKDCQAEIQSLYEAQTYAALYLLDHAVQQVREIQPTPKWYEFNNVQTDDLATFREKVRDIIKQTEIEIPCVGKVAFDNIGQLKNPKFELVTVTDGELHIGPLDELINELQVETLLGFINE